MKKEDVKSIDWYLDRIEGFNQKRCKQMLVIYRDKFEKAPGSKEKHQAWPGGYLWHIRQCMELACQIYPIIAEFGGVEFSLSDALLVLFLHDLEKPFKYVDSIELVDGDQKFEFIKKQAFLFKINLNEMHLNGLKYIHGEGHDHNPQKRVQGPLAAFCGGCCDNVSARIFHSIQEDE